MPLPAFRLLVVRLSNLRTGKVLFSWTCDDPLTEPFYAPTTLDIMPLIREAQVVRAERIHENRIAGAKKAAETRKRKKVEAALATGLVDESPADEDVVVRAKKRVKIDLVESEEALDKDDPIVLDDDDDKE